MMTKRENLEKILSLLNGTSITEEETENLIAFVIKEINKNTKAKVVDDELSNKIYEVLTKETKTANEIFNALEDSEATKAQVVYRLNALAKEGKIKKSGKDPFTYSRLEVEE